MSQEEAVQQVNPPEAGFSISWQVRDQMGTAVTVTMRAATAKEWPQIMATRKAFMELAMERGGWQPLSTAPAAPQAQAPATAPASAPAAAAPAQPAAGNGASGAHAETEGGSYDVTRMVVRPEPGGKVTLEFWRTGRKWPEITAKNWDAARAAELLAPVTGQNLKEAADLALPGAGWRVHFTYGKPKSSGNGRWEDVRRVEQL